MKIVHIVFNSHIDPVWLWPWQAGLDALLATCRIACDMLDRHPSLIYNRGEAWVYRQIELIDPDLFSRIKAHVHAGRWEIVGGWWIQPDCNQPSGFALEKQIELGREFFTSRFGHFPEVAYNVDSFGHAATLPGYLATHGQKYYVMMRPQEHERALPARLFRWRGYPGGQEVTAFRIAGSYNAGDIKWEHIDKSLTELPEGIRDTMCFVSAGDHGGGPTEKQIAWIQENQHAVDGVKLEFSSPARFFARVAPQIPSLPLVTGELQMHAIGCYSVHRQIKAGLRRAEDLMHQADSIRSRLGNRAASLPDLRRGWEQICFNHFHDTLGGTCIPSANLQAIDQIGEAASLAGENLQLGLRILLADLPENPAHRMVVYNPGPRDFGGYFEAEPWTEGMPWKNVRILDEKGKTVSGQLVHTEASCGGMHRVLFPVQVPAGERRVLHLRRDLKPAHPAAPDAIVKGKTLQNRLGVTVVPGARTALVFGSKSAGNTLRPELELIDDPSDTWSHRIDRYDEKAAARPRWDRAQFLDHGPLMASFLQTGAISQSRLRAEYRVHARRSWVELRLQVHWMEKHKLLKLVLRLPDLGTERMDGILGGQLTRPNSGAESPLRDWTLFSLENGGKLAVVCPDVYALDATKRRLRLTLLRSPLLAHHEPNPGTDPRATIADQGVHEFRFLFRVGPRLRPEDLEHEAWQLREPPLYADTTRGMPASCWAGL
ncbi:MAG: glycoside hydrolase family 38 C-terminal domain-containing protein [Terrimicrobiaceae bacterium]|nr:glycoside hydrolase family 38 C-terminal domain-containing protein [Terrimicrobiaceae bacterium]